MDTNNQNQSVDNDYKKEKQTKDNEEANPVEIDELYLCDVANVPRKRSMFEQPG